MSGQPPGPRPRRTRSAIGDVGEGPQPRGGPVLPIRLMPPLGAERGQHPGPGRRVLGPGLLQPDQRLRLSRRPQAGSITPRQEPQPGPHHSQRLHRTRRRSRLTKSAHGRDHLPYGTGRRDGPAGAARTPRAYDSITSSILLRGSDKRRAPDRPVEKRKNPADRIIPGARQLQITKRTEQFRALVRPDRPYDPTDRTTRPT